MSDEQPEVKEKEVKEFPGWTKVQLGTSRRYRSPGGVEISAARFMQLALKYKGSYIPESDVLPPTKNSNTGFFGDVTSKSSTPNPSPTKSQKNLVDQIPDEQGEQVVSLPPPTSRPSKRRADRASAADISGGIYITLTLLTAAVAYLTKFPELQMSEPEAKAIAIPMGNLIEPTKLNEQFGHMIANSGDWQMLGYAIWAYGQRVSDAMKARKEYAKSARPITTTTGLPGTPAESNGHNRGASMPYSGAGQVWPPGTTR